MIFSCGNSREEANLSWHGCRSLEGGVASAQTPRQNPAPSRELTNHLTINVSQLSRPKK